MTREYDNWERLVRAALRREELWRLCHDHSRTPSGGSTSTASPGSTSPAPETPPGHRAQSLLSGQTGQPGPTKDDKPMMMMRRKKSIIRLDRWILTRWLSGTFTSSKVAEEVSDRR
ncbi:Callose synthase 10 [Striga hermonthica]|uniref:Callose synthase 10 n=1 Tax=Striga hermonthica TaxID=68872 RepID=A0A9N7MTY9_STRHE|nr:Callose synthase 10 [Striga hermonthica]